ncbi:hypothetical protein L9F63_001349, partial [Diploptera punctata]
RTVRIQYTVSKATKSMRICISCTTSRKSYGAELRDRHWFENRFNNVRSIRPWS